MSGHGSPGSRLACRREFGLRASCDLGWRTEGLDSVNAIWRVLELRRRGSEDDCISTYLLKSSFYTLAVVAQLVPTLRSWCSTERRSALILPVTSCFLLATCGCKQQLLGEVRGGGRESSGRHECTRKGSGQPRAGSCWEARITVRALQQVVRVRHRLVSGRERRDSGARHARVHMRNQAALHSGTPCERESRCRCSGNVSSTSRSVCLAPTAALCHSLHQHPNLLFTTSTQPSNLVSRHASLTD